MDGCLRLYFEYVSQHTHTLVYASVIHFTVNGREKKIKNNFALFAGESNIFTHNCVRAARTRKYTLQCESAHTGIVCRRVVKMVRYLDVIAFVVSLIKFGRPVIVVVWHRSNGGSRKYKIRLVCEHMMFRNVWICLVI